MAYKHSELYECVAGGMGVYDLKILRDGTDGNVYTYNDDYEEMAEDFWGNDEARHIDFSPVFNGNKMKSRILMWHGLQDPISPILHMDKMKEELDKLTDKEIKEIRNAVVDLDVMPSMRCLMTSGEALKRENVAGYNCSYVKVDSPRSFDEILYILMNGTGVGFSVEEEYVNKLPSVAEEFYETESVIVVRDSKLGWAKALKELYAMLWMGQVPTWDLSKVRPAGSPLKTFGGRASGPEPLEDLFKFSINIFKNAAGRKLRPVEAHDLVCKIAEIVVVGGVRRSALISLSDLNDREMRFAKSGQWWENNVQRALANNSVNYKEKPDIGTYMREWLSLYDSKSGERGIYNGMSAKTQVEKLNEREEDGTGGFIRRRDPRAVSYTHLTLPTNREV